MTVFVVRVMRRFVCLSLEDEVTGLGLESNKGWDGVGWCGTLILKESNKVGGEGGESIV